MNRHLLLLIFLVLTSTSYCQITFEKGYFIDNSGKKIECLIKNMDWKNNPIEFNYKLTSDNEIKTASIHSVKEFGILNTSKYLRTKVMLDISSDNFNNLSKDRKPEFEEKHLFLKALVEGKASLYAFKNEKFTRFFYNVDDNDIQQLVFKYYKASFDKVGTSTQYKQQLIRDLKCSTINANRLKYLEYKKSDLIKFFIDYNTCAGAVFENFEEKQKRDAFNISIRPRINSSSLTVENPFFNPKNNDFGNEIGFGLGIELEYVLPFNKNKWSTIFEPTYRSYNSEISSDSNNVSGGKLVGEIDYSSIELPIGVRHYIFLNESSKMFINLSIVVDVDLGSTIEYKRADNSGLIEVETDSRFNLALGIGYKLKNKYSLEFRYFTNRQILNNLIDWNSDYKNISLVFGYSVL